MNRVGVACVLACCLFVTACAQQPSVDSESPDNEVSQYDEISHLENARVYFGVDQVTNDQPGVIYLSDVEHVLANSTYYADLRDRHDAENEAMLMVRRQQEEARKVELEKQLAKQKALNEEKERKRREDELNRKISSLWDQWCDGETLSEDDLTLLDFNHIPEDKKGVCRELLWQKWCTNKDLTDEEMALIDVDHIPDRWVDRCDVGK